MSGEEIAFPAGRVAIRGATVHNLQNIDVSFPRESLVVVTGPSGSGKSSLVFSTIVAEADRRLRPLFLGGAPLPSAATARISGAGLVVNPGRRAGALSGRQSVATVLGLDEHIAVLFVRAGELRCERCGGVFERSTIQQMVRQASQLAPGGIVLVFAPIAADEHGSFTRRWNELARRGFVRARVDRELVRLDLSAEDVGIERAECLDLFVDAIRVGPPGSEARIREAIEIALTESGGRVILGASRGDHATADETELSTRLRCVSCGHEAHPCSTAELRHLSPHGRCAECKGLGMIFRIDERAVVSDPLTPMNAGGLIPWANRSFAKLRSASVSALREAGVSSELTWEALTDADRRAAIVSLTPVIVQELTKNRALERLVRSDTCPTCIGSRTRRRAEHILLGGLSAADLLRGTLNDATVWLDALAPLLHGERPALVKIFREMELRVTAAVQLGLGHLALSRGAYTLSAGERERLETARYVGLPLSGMLYALDEPTAGLHPDDTERLIAVLRGLVRSGSTVIVVEHDVEVMRAADWLVELGPGGGTRGGQLVASLEKEAFVHSGTATALSLHGPAPMRRRPDPSPRPLLRFTGMTTRNLRSLDVDVPLGSLVAIAGVSGSGKTTMLLEAMLPALDLALHRKHERDPDAPFELDAEAFGRLGVRAVEGFASVRGVVDCTSVGDLRSTRSVVATASGVAPIIRMLYARTIDARVKGLGEDCFSFNHPRGACARCRGTGTEPGSDPDDPLICVMCEGTRFSTEIRAVRFRGMDIGELFRLSIDEAEQLLSAVPRARLILRRLADLRLGYLSLGQPARTLSRGEIQRIRLSRAMVRREAGSVYVFDEPTIGLHGTEVAALSGLLRMLVEAGHTVLLIEHNIDLLRAADHIIELGPGAGDEGGMIIASGPPEAIAASSRSRIARHLR